MIFENVYCSNNDLKIANAAFISLDSKINVSSVSVESISSMFMLSQAKDLIKK